MKCDHCGKKDWCARRAILNDGGCQDWVYEQEHDLSIWWEARLANQKQEYAIDDSGYHLTSYGKTDSIEWLVPAVPCEDRHHSGQSINEPLTYWGYTSVPELGVQWWRRLPTRCAQEVGR